MLAYQDISADTIWATQDDIAHIFNVKRPAITKHIRNILKDKELHEKSVCPKMERIADDGKRYQVQIYNLDIILAVIEQTQVKRLRLGNGQLKLLKII